MNSIVLIIIHIGKWPRWFHIFLETCKFNNTITFLLFSDNDARDDFPENVRYFKYDLDQFSDAASKRLGLDIKVKNPYKLCDFKPTYGLIFEEYIDDFAYWGYCDTDVVLGNIRHFITEDILRDHDVISTKSAYLAGHFTLFRNNDFNRHLFLRSKDNKRVFTKKRNYCFDECNYMWFYLLQGGTVFDFESEVESMTHIVKNMERSGQLRVYLKDLVIERDNVDSFGNFSKWDARLLWRKGKLYDLASNSECMYFHFHLLKKEVAFKQTFTIQISDEFMITKDGFSELVSK